MGHVAAAAKSQPVESVKERVIEIHQKHHFGVARTAELARQQLGGEVPQEIIKELVRQCDRCARICPNSSMRAPKRKLSVHRG